MSITDADGSLVRLGRLLLAHNYQFIAVTPETHRRNLERSTQAEAGNLRDIFGWNRWFMPSDLPPLLLEALQCAGALEHRQGRLRSLVRAARLRELLILHSAYPTTAQDAVFFGPDTYRFADFLDAEVPAGNERAAEIGCGSGAAGLVLAPRCAETICVDINPLAVRMARVNVDINAGVPGSAGITVLESDVLSAVAGPLDLVVANPPYLCDPLGRTYRDGGGAHGTHLTVRMIAEAMELLAPAGRLLVYSGTPVVDGRDQLLRDLAPIVERCGAQVRYREIDPDVFGEELERPSYGRCERIAVVGLTITRSDPVRAGTRATGPDGAAGRVERDGKAGDRTASPA